MEDCFRVVRATMAIMTRSKTKVICREAGVSTRINIKVKALNLSVVRKRRSLMS
jgi:hypothetical protein